MAALAPIAVLAILSTLLLCTNTVKSQVLTPPYFNLAVGKRVHATATCGEGVPEKELYCKLTGANPGRGAEEEPDFEVIQGQLCDYCHPRIPTQAHPPSNVLDGTEHWWQSPPLSRGLQFNEVNLTIDLGQVRCRFRGFHHQPCPRVCGVWVDLSGPWRGGGMHGGEGWSPKQGPNLGGTVIVL